jgi:uncharacterized protein
MSALPSLLRILGVLVVAYLVVATFVFLMQERLVFLPNVPGRELVATPAVAGMEYQDLRVTTEDGEELHAWWIPAPAASGGAGAGAGARPRGGAGADAGDQRAGTVVVFHGNAGNISHRLETARIWHGLGWSVFLFDYRGYGQSTGRPSETGTYRDARAVWRHVTEERGIPSGEVVLFGRSLGAAVAARLATEVAPLALILESGFTSAPDLAAELYWWLPVRLLARVHYPTVDLVPEVDAPVLVIHSPYDEIIPFHHGRALYEAARPPRELLELVGGHNDGFLRTGDAYSAGIERFLERALRARPERQGTGSP